MGSRIVIVGDRMLWNSLLGYFLTQQGHTIIDIQTSTRETIQHIRKSSPDLVLIDNRSSTNRGARQVLSIKNEFPKQKVILLSSSQKPQELLYMLRSGTDGYLQKSTTPEQLLSDINAVCAGETRVSPELTHVLIAHAKHETTSSQQDIDRLTMREKEILELLASGRTNQEIAAFLSISINTVKNHVKSILSKLSMHSRSQAIVFWGTLNNLSGNAGTKELR